MLRLTLRLAVLTVLAVLVPAHAPAGADSATGPGLDLGNNRIHWIKGTNGTQRITSTVRLTRVPRAGEAAFDIDVAGNDASSMYRFHKYVVLIGKRAGSAPTTAFKLVSSAGNRYLSCPGLAVNWNRADRRISMSLPHTCLGADKGMARIGFQGPDEVTHGSAVRTRVLQRGARGARYGDVNGDGRVDRVRVRPEGDRYVVTVTLPGRTVRASGPLTGSANYPRPATISRLDVNKNGRAEIFVDPNDELGDGSDTHLFTLANGRLEVVRKAGGGLFTLGHAFAGMDVYSDYRCTGRVIQSWRLIGGHGTDRYTVRATTWRLNGSVAVKGSTRQVSGPKSAFAYGNWSGESCSTR